jgi:hypothetical protein
MILIWWFGRLSARLDGRQDMGIVSFLDRTMQGTCGRMGAEYRGQRLLDVINRRRRLGMLWLVKCLNHTLHSFEVDLLMADGTRVYSAVADQ